MSILDTFRDMAIGAYQQWNSIKEPTTEEADNLHRPIGSDAVLKGKPVKWAGPDLEWQSPETFKKLETEGYKGDVDYLSKWGWQSNRANLGIAEALKIAKPVLEPVMSTAQKAYNIIPERSATRELIEGGARNVAWGLGKVEEGQTWLSRKAGVHPLPGNMAIETIADVLTGPLVPTTALALAGKVETGGDIVSALKKAKRLKLTRTDEVLNWIDEGNEFIRKRGSQRGWENKIFTDSDGNQWQLKSQGTGKDAKPRSMEAAGRDAAGRNLRENAWKAQLKEVLEQRGTYTPERYNELSTRIKSQINKMKTHIRNVNKGKPREEWISFGHKKSLAKDGVNVPENVVFEPYLENVSTQHKFDASDAAVRQSGGPLSIEEWVVQQELLEEFGDNILPYGGLPNDLQIKILKTKGQVARDALIEAYYLKNTKM